jgi:hypothetical protein
MQEYMERKRVEMDAKVQEERARADMERLRPLEWRRQESDRGRMVGCAEQLLIT